MDTIRVSEERMMPCSHRRNPLLILTCLLAHRVRERLRA
jgi:hypothetical protein